MEECDVEDLEKEVDREGREPRVPRWWSVVVHGGQFGLYYRTRRNVTSWGNPLTGRQIVVLRVSQAVLEPQQREEKGFQRASEHGMNRYSRELGDVPHWSQDAVL